MIKLPFALRRPFSWLELWLGGRRTVSLLRLLIRLDRVLSRVWSSVATGDRLGEALAGDKPFTGDCTGTAAGLTVVWVEDARVGSLRVVKTSVAVVISCALSAASSWSLFGWPCAAAVAAAL